MGTSHFKKEYVAFFRNQGKIREYGLENVIDENDLETHDTKNLEMFKDLVNNLKTLGFRPDFGLNVVFKVVVSIILLFELQMKVSKDNKTLVDAKNVIKAISHNLEIDETQLETAFNEFNVNCHKEFKEEKSDLKVVIASLATILFTNLIDWIENFIKMQLKLR